MDIYFNLFKLLNLIVYLLLLVKLAFVLVKQYYTLTRFYKSLISYLKYYNLVFIFELLIIFIPFKSLSSFFSLFIGIILVIKIPLIKLRISRRSILLIMCSTLIYIVMIYFFEYTSRLFFLLISLSLAYLFLLPLELSIKSYYLRKARKKIKDKKPIIIGITGSFGKTSLKHYLVNILATKYIVGYPKDNNNTLMGICKYINNEFNNEELLVVELGIDSKRQMERFKKLFSLDYAFITSIGNMHLSTFKSVENIILEKMKIKKLLKPNGLLYLNEDNEYLNRIEGVNIIKFSSKNVKILKYSIEGYILNYYQNEYLFPVHQKFFTSYLDGIVKLCQKLSIEEKDIYLNSFKFKDYKRRNEIFTLNHGYMIDNSYNANLLGILDSLELLDSLKGEKIVITGGIIEQGSNFILENQKLRDALNNHQVIFIGESTHPLVKNHSFEKLLLAKDINHAYKLVKELDPDHVLLLCKGENIYLR